MNKGHKRDCTDEWLNQGQRDGNQLAVALLPSWCWCTISAEWTSSMQECGQFDRRMIGCLRSRSRGVCIVSPCRKASRKTRGGTLTSPTFLCFRFSFQTPASQVHEKLTTTCLTIRTARRFYFSLIHSRFAFLVHSFQAPSLECYSTVRVIYVYPLDKSLPFQVTKVRSEKLHK